MPGRSAYHRWQADGTDMSLFVITEMKEAHQKWLANGQRIAVELAVHFEEYIPFSDIGSTVSITGGIPGFEGEFF